MADPEVFTWVPTSQPVGTVTFALLSAKFGDGYKQVAADGINNRSESWPLTFTGTRSTILAIKQFLDRQGGAMPFYWTPPLGDQGLYLCSSYQPTPVGGLTYTLTATFEQAFHP